MRACLVLRKKIVNMNSVKLGSKSWMSKGGESWSVV